MNKKMWLTPRELQVVYVLHSRGPTTRANIERWMADAKTRGRGDMNYILVSLRKHGIIRPVGQCYVGIENTWELALPYRAIVKTQVKMLVASAFGGSITAMKTLIDSIQ